MITDKRVIFGFGSIVTSSNSMLRRVTFQHIQPNQKIGTNITNDILRDATLLEKVEFNHGEDMREFIRVLDSVNEDNPIVQFRGYTFDFSEYNEKSVSITRKAFYIAYRGFQLALAC